MENSKLDRRHFLRGCAFTLGAVTLLGAGGAKWALTADEGLLIQNSYQKEEGMKKILIAYASKCGSTGEIADAIGKVLAEAGRPVEVMPVKQVKSLEGYAGVVLGTALRFEKPLPEMMDFANRFGAELRQRPLALFSAGTYMREDTPENRQKTRGFLKPLLAALPEPLSLEMFGGKVQYSTMEPFWRFLVSMDRSGGVMREGDGRNWLAIRAWADQLCTRLPL